MRVALEVGIPALGDFAIAEQRQDLPATGNVMRLNVEDELILRPLFVVGQRLKHLAGVDVEEFAEDGIHRHKGRRHAARCRQELAARDAEQFGIVIGELDQVMLNALLLVGLRVGKILLV